MVILCVANFCSQLKSIDFVLIAAEHLKRCDQHKNNNQRFFDGRKYVIFIVDPAYSEKESVSLFYFSLSVKFAMTLLLIMCLFLGKQYKLPRQ